jgi:hypothetical protein
MTMGFSSSPGRVKNFNFSISSGPAVGITQLPTQWIPAAGSPRVKLLVSAEVQKNVDVYTNSPVRFHGSEHRDNFAFFFFSFF